MGCECCSSGLGIDCEVSQGLMTWKLLAIARVMIAQIVVRLTASKWAETSLA